MTDIGPTELVFFMIGALLGGAAGYAVGAYRVNRQVESRVKNVEKKVGIKDEKGQVDRGTVQFAAVLLAMLSTIVAVIVTAQTNNRVQENVYCNKQFLVRTVDALNDRTAFTGAQLEQQRKLNKSQLEFLLSIRNASMPGFNQDQLDMYIEALRENERVLDRRQQDLSRKYPTAEEITRCPSTG